MTENKGTTGCTWSSGLLGELRSPCCLRIIRPKIQTKRCGCFVPKVRLSWWTQKNSYFYWHWCLLHRPLSLNHNTSWESSAEMVYGHHAVIGVLFKYESHSSWLTKANGMKVLAFFFLHIVIKQSFCLNLTSPKFNCVYVYAQLRLQDVLMPIWRLKLEMHLSTPEKWS